MKGIRRRLHADRLGGVALGAVIPDEHKCSAISPARVTARAKISGSDLSMPSTELNRHRWASKSLVNPAVVSTWARWSALSCPVLEIRPNATDPSPRPDRRRTSTSATNGYTSSLRDGQDGRRRWPTCRRCRRTPQPHCSSNPPMPGALALARLMKDVCPASLIHPGCQSAVPFTLPASPADRTHLRGCGRRARPGHRERICPWSLSRQRGLMLALWWKTLPGS